MITVLAISLAVVALGAAVGVVVLWGRLTAAERTADGAVAQARDALQQAADGIERANRAEAVVTLLKANIAQLEKELDACATPDAVRARFQRLLG